MSGEGSILGGGKMGINIVEIEEKEKYSRFDLFNIMPRANLNEGVALGIIDEEEMPIGLVVCKYCLDNLMIEWMWIEPPYRNMGIGHEVVYSLAGFAKEREISTISVYLVESANRVAFCNSERRYFRNQGFLKDVKLKGQWQAQLKQIIISDYFKGEVSSVQTLALQSLPDEKREDYVSRLQAVKGAMISQEINLCDETIDLDLFILACEGENILGAVCINVVEDDLYITYLWASNEAIERALLAKAFLNAKRKYGPYVNVQCIMYTEDYCEQFNQLMPGSHLNTSMLTATPDEILNLEDADLSYLNFWDEMNISTDVYMNTLAEYFKPADVVELGRDALLQIVEKGIPENDIEVEQFDKLDLKQFEDVISLCKAGKHAGVFARIPASFSIEWVDLEVSYVAKKGEELKGVFLIGKNENTLIPLILYAWNSDGGGILLSLIHASVKSILEKYTDEIKIELRCHDDFVLNLYNKLFLKK